MLQARGDVENAIVAYLKSHEQLASYELATAAAQRAVNVSAARYQNGLVDFNTVISTLKDRGIEGCSPVMCDCHTNKVGVSRKTHTGMGRKAHHLADSQPGPSQ